MHQVIFKGVENSWHNALPLGNGRMGAMVFRKGNAVHIALNHYDCYYKILSYDAQDKKSTFDDPARRENRYEDLCQIVERAMQEPEYERTHYHKILNPECGKGRPQYRTSSYPMVGEIVVRFAPEVDTENSSLCLQIEEGRVIWQAGKENNTISMEIFVSDKEDGVLMLLKQSGPGLWKEAGLTVPSTRGCGSTLISEYIEENQLIYHMTLGLDEEKKRGEFISETAVTIEKGMGKACKTGVCKLYGENEIIISACVFPQKQKAAEKGKYLIENKENLLQKHKEKWREFQVSSVCLPDKFLETLWYLSLYLLECCSGRGGKYVSQACGLSGLWDIRRPNLWGSMWYWDVNIQTVFQGMFMANHLELSQDFCNAYLSYEKKIRDYTKRIYGIDGWALDYPHPLYNSIQPWCAQFLWNFYLYSQDKEFLSDKVYPVLRKQILFFCFLAKKDAKGKFYIEPDISPEQGPVSRNSVITIAAIKKLLEMGIQAAGILDKLNEAAEMTEILAHLPSYSETENHTRFKDSEGSQEIVFLRHPSILMPIFPAGEITWLSEESVYQKALNTLDYAIEHTEIGTFGYSWLACAASVLGDGSSAIRILYEKGLEHILHSNGLGYEESERFINYCHITKPSNYLPAMCEAAGGIVSAVNSMLLFCGKKDVISVFPAIPNGKEKLKFQKSQYLHENCITNKKYEAWREVRFEGFLAPGGFEVSAYRTEGKTMGIEINSQKGGRLKIILPAELSENDSEILFTKEMQKGEKITFGYIPGKEKITSGKKESNILMQKSGETGRRIFIGEDKNTEFYKAWDTFTCPYYLGNTRQQQMTPYIFDFTCYSGNKNYEDVYGVQYYKVQESILYAAGPISVGMCLYDPDKGYGFDSIEGLEMADRARPDDIRRDFIQGSIRREFAIELPRGKYNLLIVSGDEEEASETLVGLPQNGMQLGVGVQCKGKYQCLTLPLLHREDGNLRISFDTVSGMKWKLNALIVNKEYALL